jgi:hypothetical protein
MNGISLFRFTEYWWFYIAFTLFVLGMLALDLGCLPSALPKTSLCPNNSLLPKKSALIRHR